MFAPRHTEIVEYRPIRYEGVHEVEHYPNAPRAKGTLRLAGEHGPWRAKKPALIEKSIQLQLQH
jgi:hypothetical protein